MILYSLDKYIPQGKIKTHKENRKSIKIYLNDMIEGEDIHIQSTQILFVELLVFVLVFLVRIVPWVFHPHTYYSLQPDMVIFLL